MDLTGKVAIVTGSGRGLGLAYARRLAGSGAAVVVNDVDAEVAEAAVEAIRRDGGKASAVTAAVGDSEVAQALVDHAVETFGRLDVLVSNAGVLRDKVLWKMTDEDFDLVTRVHLRGTFTCARAAVVQMKEQGEGGRIILIGSPAGQYGNFGQTNYSAAKAGIVGLTKAACKEVAFKNVRVNAIQPGYIRTAMTEAMPEHVKEAKVAEVPMGRPGEVSEVASVAVFLASDMASYMTGTVLEISGGRHI